MVLGDEAQSPRIIGPVPTADNVSSRRPLGKLLPALSTPYNRFILLSSAG